MKVFSVFLAICLSATAFSPLADRRLGSIGGQTRSTTSSSSFPLFAGGFGGGGKKSKGSSNKSASKPTKLKPKQQWDRYLDMKTETKIAVGVRMKEDDSDDWFQVGHIRSKDGAHTTLSVAIQRALIAEVRILRQYIMIWIGPETFE